MPLTLFAHQVPTMGMKMARPRWFDGTALCVGSMAPDFAYSVSSYADVDTHWWDGFWAVDLPIALVATLMVRWFAASVAGAHLPDLGGFRLHSWRVLHRRPPRWWVTAISLVLGVATHIGLDSFTHPRRAGTKLLGYDDIEFQLWGTTEPLAGVFQLIGHTFGSMVGLWLLLLIGKRHLLERWYGVEEVDHARHFQLGIGGRVVFWALAAGGLGAGALWGHEGDMVERIQRPLVGCMLGVFVACAVPICRPRTSPVPVPPRTVPQEPQPR